MFVANVYDRQFVAKDIDSLFSLLEEFEVEAGIEEIETEFEIEETP